MEPAAVLVMAFKVQVGFRTLGVVGWPCIGILVAATQHMGKGATGVKPHFQNVSAFGVAGGIRRAEDVFGRHTAPGLNAALFDDIGGLVQDLHGAGVQLTTVFVQKEGHRHAPAALAADAPVRPVGNHVAQACLAVLGVKAGVVDSIQCQLAQSFGRLVFGKDARALIHADEPLGRGAVDHRCLVAPAVRVAVGDGLGGHQAVALA